MNRFLFMLITVLVRVAPAAGQIDWTPYEGNPVMGQDFDIESQVTYRPSVIKWQGKYHLWYGKYWQNSRWVAYAVSDDGIDWGTEPADNAVLGPSATDGRFDELEATHGWVILEGDTLKMWYSGYGNKASGIGLAWSLNGYTWTKVTGPAAGGSVLDPETDGTGALVITHPAVVKQGGMYHMWYVRAKSQTNALIGYARSSDGKSWQVVQGGGTNGSVLDYGASGSFDALALFYPAAIYNKDHFEMWYQGLAVDNITFSVIPRVGCARSDDGITWQKIPSEPNEAGECFRSFAQPFVMIDDGQYKMWYGLSATGQNGDVISYATSGEVGTAVQPSELPDQPAVLEIYPNPSSGATNLRFMTRRQGAYVLEVRDVLGRAVSYVELGVRSIGPQTAVWDATDSQGGHLAPGAYLLGILNKSLGERVAAGIVRVVR